METEIPPFAKGHSTPPACSPFEPRFKDSALSAWQGSFFRLRRRSWEIGYAGDARLHLSTPDLYIRHRHQPRNALNHRTEYSRFGGFYGYDRIRFQKQSGERIMEFSSGGGRLDSLIMRNSNSRVSTFFFT